jgi:hypothetical protein
MVQSAQDRQPDFRSGSRDRVAAVVSPAMSAMPPQAEETAGNVEGRKSWVELNPTVVAEARRLRRKSPKGSA